jgi:spore maturation protein CgeB
MRVVMFYHSLVSDWNHGNAHFLRGMVGELRARGHEVIVYEPEDGWSLRNLLETYGEQAIARFECAYPGLTSRRYALETLDLEQALDGADLVLVHEWNPHALVARLGALRARSSSFRLLFHDTHHRAVSEPAAMAGYDLRHYDGVLAFGRVIADLYLERGWTQRAWVFHEAADTRRFRPLPGAEKEGDLVFIGNWGDGERSHELREYLIDPVQALGLRACVYGVRYPDEALRVLADANMTYAGWLPNHDAPEVFSRFAVTVHVPRRPYAETLRGVPTIRVFEALACSIPLVCAPWDDSENLFRPGTDYLVASDGAQMKRAVRAVVSDRALARELSHAGLQTILSRHTCAHRTNELLQIHRELGGQTA